MKKVSLEQIANENGLSKTTVSKALNNCFGIDYETKKAVLCAVEKSGYINEEKSAAAQVGIVLPANPTYFWRSAFRGITEECSVFGLDTRAFIYNTLANTEELLGCLGDATQAGVKTLIIAAHDTESVREAIGRMALNTPVILLTEFINLKNTFFVGADAYSDGCLLAKMTQQQYPTYKRILMYATAETHSATQRMRGFADVYQKAGIAVTEKLILPKDSKVFSSMIAREISMRFSDGIDLVFCADGVLPDVCLAIKKLKVNHPMICVGFEKPDSVNRYIEEGILGALVQQDIEGQGRKAAHIANEYIKTGCMPEQKIIVVDSAGEVYLNDNNTHMIWKM